MKRAAATRKTDAQLYAELMRFGVAFANESHPYVVELWMNERHPREALDAVLGLMATHSPEARELRTHIKQNPDPMVLDVLARAFWDGVTVRIDGQGCTP
jgi:hypothetical protein